MAQQLRLGAERLLAHGAGEVRKAVLRGLGVLLYGHLKKHLVAPAAAAVRVQVSLFVIGQTGKVVELLAALAAVVDGPRAVAALVHQQLGRVFEDSVALEAGVRPTGPGVRRAVFFLGSGGLTSRVCQGGATGPVGPQVTDHLQHAKGSFISSVCVCVRERERDTDLRAIDETFPALRTLVSHPL